MRRDFEEERLPTSDGVYRLSSEAVAPTLRNSRSPDASASAASWRCMACMHGFVWGPVWGPTATLRCCNPRVAALGVGILMRQAPQ